MIKSKVALGIGSLYKFFTRLFQISKNYEFIPKLEICFLGLVF